MKWNCSFCPDPSVGPKFGVKVKSRRIYFNPSGHLEVVEPNAVIEPIHPIQELVFYLAMFVVWLTMAYIKWLNRR